jgi:hypothetical protein
MDYNASTTTNNWLQQSSGINNGGVCESSSENMLNTSPLSNSSNGGNVEMRSNDSGDAEGVWSPDIDQVLNLFFPRKYLICRKYRFTGYPRHINLIYNR